MLVSRFALPLLLGSLVSLSYAAAVGDDDTRKGVTRPGDKAAKDDKKADEQLQQGESGLNNARIIDLINKEIEKGWKENKIQPSAIAGDAEWIRRAFIDIIGRIPSAIPTTTAKEDKVLAKGELEYFLSLPANGRRAAVMKYLLNHEDYAKHWANVWTIWLITRTTQAGIDRQNLRSWLERQFGENRRYDEIVTDLITATATGEDGCASKTEKNAGAANFLLSHFGERVAQEHRIRDGQFEMVPATSRITRVFLGVQTQCTQCHDHPFIDDRKQGQFWGVNAFLRQVMRDPPVIMPQNRNMTLRHYKLRDNLDANAEAGVFYERRNGLIQRTGAVWLDKTRPTLSTSTPRRQELARLVVGDEIFAKAIVNRMWAHFMGRGFTNPVDDFGEHNPVSHPELLDRLAKDFVTSGYDLQRLITWITSSRPYHLSSMANPTNSKQEAEPYFARMQLKSMSPEALVDSVFTATNFVNIKYPNNPQARRDTMAQWLRDFTINFGDDEGNEATFNGTVVQALLLMNGQRLNEAVETSLPVKVAMNSTKPLDVLYLTALSRPPTAKERDLFSSAITSSVHGPVYRKDPARLYKDVLWALFNSNEFILNH